MEFVLFKFQSSLLDYKFLDNEIGNKSDINQCGKIKFRIILIYKKWTFSLF